MPSAVEIQLLGRFEVTVDGRPVPEGAWTRRTAASLVKLLALAPSRRLHREQVMEALWPDVGTADAAPKLHTAAHYARQALGAREALVLRPDAVALLPEVAAVDVDVVEFEEAGEAALRDQDSDAAEHVVERFDADLLPTDRYEPWTEATREHLRSVRLDLLRLCGRWADVLALEPTDEDAHLQKARELADAGDVRGALRQLERMERALQHELGVAPSRTAIALRERLQARIAGNAAAPPSNTLVGRERQLRALEQLLRSAAAGRGGTAFVSGPAGVGKSALVGQVRDLAQDRGWRCGTGAAAEIEGAWPYAPVLEALADLCRRHPTLLDGLDDAMREEIDRALAGRDLAWGGESAHQRLFLAAAELLRLASAGNGAVLVIEDLHDADEASLRLLHYLTRASTSERVLLLLSHRPQRPGTALDRMRSSLLGRRAAVELRLPALDHEAVGTLLRRVDPAVSAEFVSGVLALSGGLPFAVLELGRHGDDPRRLRAEGAAALPADARSALERVAVLGLTFGSDEFVALAEVPEARALAHLDSAVATGLVQRTDSGYRFRHALLRESLLEGLPPGRLSQLHADAAARLIELDASPARVGQHLRLAGQAGAAVPFVLRAAQTSAAVGAYRDALELVNSVRSAALGSDRAPLLALRADLLAAVGDPEVVEAYREALHEADPPDRPLLRARLSRAALMNGDLGTAAAALDGTTPDGGPADASILLARGNLEWLRGNLDQAWKATDEARRRVVSEDSSWQLLDLIALQGLIAHNRGEWFQRLRQEVLRTRDAPRLATAIFDSHLCVAEYLLYGPMPYAEVVDIARSLRKAAERAGALRAIAFACALQGEAALLAGDLADAERDLLEAIALHREIGAAAGEAHSLQRLAEVRLAQGDRAAAEPLLHRAIPLARWSPVPKHLLQRIFGSLIIAAPDWAAARAVIDRAEATLGNEDYCQFCHIMLAVPVVIAAADAGDLVTARRYLAAAEDPAPLWEGTAWEGATLEARAHLLRAEGNSEDAARLLVQAAAMFDAVGQPLDVARCRKSSLPVPAPRRRQSSRSRSSGGVPPP